MKKDPTPKESTAPAKTQEKKAAEFIAKMRETKTPEGAIVEPCKDCPNLVGFGERK